MEEAILKTLIYADIFDYPLKAWEIHKWLIGKRISFKQIEKAINRLNQKSKIKNQKGYYFLPQREKTVVLRLKREEQSKKYSREAKIISQIFKLIPWVKLVGLSGSLAVDNAEKSDDIDLLVITDKGRLWLSRLILLTVLDMIGKRREKGKGKRKSAGKICINILLEKDQLAQKDKNIYLAHEVLQMRVLWQKDGVYSKFLEDNFWVFKFLPNWVSSTKITQNAKVKSPPAGRAGQNYNLKFKIINNFEKIAKYLQLKYMGKPKGLERVSESALYLHPEDLREKILKEYEKKLKRFTF